MGVILGIVPVPRVDLMNQDLSRRNFVKTSAAAAMVAAPAVLGAQGTGNRLRVGWIATGSRGRHV